MDKLVVQGGLALRGEITVSGAKNSALPALAACLLTSDTVKLGRIPGVRDILTMQRLLEYTGAEVRPVNGHLEITTRGPLNPEAPYDLVKTMRASSLILGPLVARHGSARVSMPGGCAIGARPIDLHLMGLERLGAEIRQEHGYIEASAPRGLTGGRIYFDKITVTGTEDLMMAATLAQGDTILENAAREPEVVDLAELLTKMGARIDGAGTSVIRVRGVEALHGAEHDIIPDRIEAGTFAIAAAITGGDLILRECRPSHLGALTQKLWQAGVHVEELDGCTMRVSATPTLRAQDMSTEEYPGFATDLQAQYMALMTQADGISIIRETIFENRFMHVLELGRMGASIRIDGRQAIVAGSRKLSGAPVIASDLRASASLLLAAMAASGETLIDRVYHLDRGYERIEEKLAAVGARIHRTAD
ncbi:MAG: UDP-N-acetylglucosamine 1-carboxyvinyltransferase [Bryobacterales bacterium]|jgi:UDP-N-acetylglucosamine 1-carboxyvinyltransferase|nr:UDP-N-acetylglucosamine 1-carboxyvinyltransferase [Bryobacterales bacterium]